MGDSDFSIRSVLLLAVLLTVAIFTLHFWRPSQPASVSVPLPATASTLTLAGGGSTSGWPLRASLGRLTVDDFGEPGDGARRLLELVIPVPVAACASLAAEVAGSCGPAPRAQGPERLELVFGGAAKPALAHPAVLKVHAESQQRLQVERTGESTAASSLGLWSIAIEAKKVVARFSCLTSLPFEISLTSRRAMGRCVPLHSSRLRLLLAFDDPSPPPISLSELSELKLNGHGETLRMAAEEGSLDAYGSTQALGVTGTSDLVLHSPHLRGVALDATVADRSSEFDASAQPADRLELDHRLLYPPSIISRFEQVILLLVGALLGVAIGPARRFLAEALR